MEEMSIGKRVGRVRASIAMFDAAEKAHREAQANPRSTQMERAKARLQMEKFENEFGWQLRNVEKILDHFGIDEDSE